ncbi:cobalamin biosynthesis protein CbiX [Nitrosospira lacus]|uniref:Cobalamin biosynthesis protein CbiX n=1 Tax=Nitrosospira lacus TaxID=1288494 RepID=A0A1W6SPT0_9PROT|nr:CbiX/SirB N-terminal domain-containing protein [Nitrosospira lacus]ARO87805.1 cobalamin biosynthesis protein CbiX [Nitrosospira lacus]
MTHSNPLHHFIFIYLAGFSTQKYPLLKRCYRLTLAALLATVLISPGFADENLGRQERRTGFLVVAADRGFLGNEEIIDSFQLFAKGRNASLVFVTDERTRKYLRNGADMLLRKGAECIVVIPLFISAATPRYLLVRQLLEKEKLDVPVFQARVYGESFIAVEDLTDKFRTIQEPAETGVVVVGYGAVDNDSEQKMQADWQRIAKKASAGFDFPSISVLVGYDKKDEDAEKRTIRLKHGLAEAANRNGGKGRIVVVPFHFGPRFDSMMSFNTGLKRLLPPGAHLLEDSGSDTGASINSSENTGLVTRNLATWMQREANRSQPPASGDMGVVILSHGSDFNWNETMREAVRPLMKRYKIEFAFSMADQPTIERALLKLEQRGAKTAVIVRVFAMEDSFRTPVERMAGLDIEGVAQDTYDAHAGQGHGHGAAAAVPAPRIRTSLPIQTVGGIGASPLFAAALLDRARLLSKNPARDTVILIAHGSGSDRQNELWTRALEDVAEQMRKAEGKEFHAIKVATWREDWPDKRTPWVDKIRAMVEDARKEGGSAIVIPARTTGQGPEDKFLSGLEYDLGSGFAPHPKFVQWVDEQVRAGMAQFADARRSNLTTVEAGDYAPSPEKDLWW